MDEQLHRCASSLRHFIVEVFAIEVDVGRVSQTVLYVLGSELWISLLHAPHRVARKVLFESRGLAVQRPMARIFESLSFKLFAILLSRREFEVLLCLGNFLWKL